VAAPARWYFLRVLPRLGGSLAGDRELYDYLSLSSADFLTPEELVGEVAQAGLRPEHIHGYLGGLVTNLIARRPGGPPVEKGRFGVGTHWTCARQERRERA